MWSILIRIAVLRLFFFFFWIYRSKTERVKLSTIRSLSLSLSFSSVFRMRKGKENPIGETHPLSLAYDLFLFFSLSGDAKSHKKRVKMQMQMHTMSRYRSVIPLLTRRMNHVLFGQANRLKPASPGHIPLMQMEINAIRSWLVPSPNEFHVTVHQMRASCDIDMFANCWMHTHTHTHIYPNGHSLSIDFHSIAEDLSTCLWCFCYEGCQLNRYSNARHFVLSAYGFPRGPLLSSSSSFSRFFTSCTTYYYYYYYF